MVNHLFFFFKTIIKLRFDKSQFGFEVLGIHSSLDYGWHNMHMLVIDYNFMIYIYFLNKEVDFNDLIFFIYIQILKIDSNKMRRYTILF